MLSYSKIITVDRIFNFARRLKRNSANDFVICCVKNSVFQLFTPKIDTFVLSGHYYSVLRRY